MLCSATVQMRKTHYYHKIKDIFRIYVRADGCSVLKEILGDISYWLFLSTDNPKLHHKTDLLITGKEDVLALFYWETIVQALFNSKKCV